MTSAYAELAKSIAKVAPLVDLPPGTEQYLQRTVHLSPFSDDRHDLTVPVVTVSEKLLLEIKRGLLILIAREQEKKEASADSELTAGFNLPAILISIEKGAHPNAFHREW